MSHTIVPNPFLRFALLADATASGAMGLLMAAGSAPLSDLLGLPARLLLGAGLVLLPYALFVGWLGRRPTIAASSVWLVIAVNALWVIDSLAILVAGHVLPTRLGLAFVLAQAAAVAVFAQLQFVGLRKGRAQTVRTA